MHRGYETKPSAQNNGIPEGSSLRVLLWLIFVYDIPLNPKLANTYFDDTIGWAVESKKEHVKGTLRHQLGKMVYWCRKNKIKINADKTHVIFNEYQPHDKIELNGMTIKTSDSIRYLGAEIIANKEENKSTFIIQTNKIAREITNRCNVIKQLRKLRIQERIFQQACHAFIGGIFNYFLPWLAGETAIKQTIRALQLAYHEYMRTYTGCMRSTPISLLYAISRFPLLQDKIITSSALTVIKAEAQGNLLGEDYRTWDQAGCDTDGWTPFGRVRFALERSLAKKFDSRIHPRK